MSAAVWTSLMEIDHDPDQSPLCFACGDLGRRIIRRRIFAERLRARSRLGVGRPGPGVYRRAPVARAVVRPVARPVARAAVVAPVAPVARAAVVTPAAPVAAAAVATPAAPVATAAAVTPAAPVAAAAVATPAVRGGRVVVVNSTRVYRPVVRRRVVVVR